MTRKEAIKILMNTAWLGTEQSDVETAVYMAVEALEREENDVLDRVLEIIAELKNENIGRDGSDEYTSACQDFRSAVVDLKGGE